MCAYTSTKTGHIWQKECKKRCVWICVSVCLCVSVCVSSQSGNLDFWHSERLFHQLWLLRFMPCRATLSCWRPDSKLLQQKRTEKKKCHTLPNPLLPLLILIRLQVSFTMLEHLQTMAFCANILHLILLFLFKRCILFSCLGLNPKESMQGNYFLWVKGH